MDINPTEDMNISYESASDIDSFNIATLPHFLDLLYFLYAVNIANYSYLKLN
jgi:hypothetical protein